MGKVRKSAGRPLCLHEDDGLCVTTVVALKEYSVNAGIMPVPRETGHAQGWASDEEKECPVCYNDFSEKHMTRCTAPCGHQFCFCCIRKTLSDQFGSCPVCRCYIALASVKDAAGMTLVDNPLPVEARLHGSTFLQEHIEGVAAYHFQEDGSAFISYESPLCAHWPHLEDGSSPPPRKEFIETSFDQAARVFCGTIDWSPTCWQGDRIWRYRMVFSSDLSTMMRGTVEAFSAAGELRRTDLFGERLRYINKMLVVTPPTLNSLQPTRPETHPGWHLLTTREGRSMLLRDLENSL